MIMERSGLAVRTSGVNKRYNATKALAGVDLEIPEGAFYVLVGPNGSGKTTLIKALLGVIRVEGSVEVMGHSPERDGALVRANIGYVPESQDVPYGWMRVEQLIRYHATYYPKWDDAYFDRLAKALDIRVAPGYGDLSKGQRRRVQLAIALAHRPRLLILDEPTDGLDPVMRERFQELLAGHLAESRTSILVSTHVIHEVERLANWLGALRGGRLEAQVGREDLYRTVRRYRLEVPDDWRAPALADGVVLRRKKAGREVQWTILGDEARIAEALGAGGARIREVVPLSLEEAALALLNPTEEDWQ